MSDRNFSRRSFLKVAGGAGIGLTLGACIPTKAHSKPSSDKNAKTFAPNVWLTIDPSGIVTITISKVDLGQGARTSLAMIVADELDVDWKNVRVVQAVADGSKYGNQGVGGSGTTMGMWRPLREAGATARAMLVAAAAQAMSVTPGGCLVSNGVVSHPSTDKKMSYGELAGLAAEMGPPEPSAVKLKTPADWKIIGKPTRRIDNPLVVQGKTQYCLDVKIPGALTAVIAMPHAFGASVAKLDDAEAKRVPGVTHVLSAPFGVVVLGENTYAALKGRDALKIEWNEGPNADFDSAKLTTGFKEAVTPWSGPIEGAAKTIEVAYELPYLAHACMEPMSCVIVPEDGKATCYVGSQFPDGPKRAIANALGLSQENVTVNVTLAGGGFGRRSQTDFAEQCAWIVKQTGKAIKLMWTREDDMRHDGYRPASYHACRGGIAADGTPVVFEHQMVNSGGGRRNGSAPPLRDTRYWYRLPAKALNTNAPSPVPTGAWRSVGNSQLGFVVESFVDELATAAGKDPLEFRRSIIDNPRLRKVLDAAAEKAGWGKPLPKGHYHGIACFSGWNTHVAHVAEISIENDKIRVHKITAAIDCGTEVNPLGVAAQIEGASLDGVTTAIKAGISIKNGGVEQTNFTDYEWIRMNEAPVVDVIHLPSGDGPGGMGEPGYPSTPPAIANAVFAATGKRARKLPIDLKELA